MSDKRRPTHWGDTRRVDVSRRETSTGIPTEVHDDLTPTPQLVERILDRVQGVSPREQQLADAIAGVISESLSRHARAQHLEQTDRLLALSSRAPIFASEEINDRLSELENWRLRLTGVADGNGRIGELTRQVHSIRADVGSSDDCRHVREAALTITTARRYMLTAIVSALLSFGGSLWGLLKAHDESVRKNAAIEIRLDQLERSFR